MLVWNVRLSEFIMIYKQHALLAVLEFLHRKCIGVAVSLEGRGLGTYTAITFLILRFCLK